MMRNPVRVPRFDEYRGENKFVFCGTAYERKEFLGEGTTACVYRFHPVNTRSSAQSVAVKVERPIKRSGIDRFEEGISFSLEAYWNNQIYGLGILSGNPRSFVKEHYLLMPYFAGVLACDITLTGARELVEWFIVVARFIHEKMHSEKKIIHGDIKLDNVIFQATEKQARVIDFGLTERVGAKIGQYSIPENTDAVLGVKKLSPEECCPQTAPELFGREMIPAEPSQDAYGLGQFILALLSRVNNISSEEITKLCFVIKHLRATRPQERCSIPGAISKLYADFILVVPRLIASDDELILKKLALFHQRRAAMYQDVRDSVAPVIVSFPLLTKAMADGQLQMEKHKVGMCDQHKDSGVLKSRPMAGALSAALFGGNGDPQRQEVRRAPGREPGTGYVAGSLGYLFAPHSVPKQDESRPKPAQP